MPKEDRADDEQVGVWLVATRAKGGLLLRGRAKGWLKRMCDRCGNSFEELADGTFDVLLNEGEEEVDESLFEDVQTVESDEIEMSRHVRDALYLGLKSRAICNEQCGGVSVQNGEQWSVFKSGDQRIDAEETIGDRSAGDRLMEMKRKLEERGL